MEKKLLADTELHVGGEFYHKLKEGDKVVGTAVIQKPITAEMIDGVICTAVEGGINYWVNSYVYDVDARPEDMPLSSWITELVLLNKPFKISETGTTGKRVDHELTLEKLIKGLQMYWANPNFQNFDFDGDADAGDCDCVIQYALFGELVYG
jgi:hypothetical protein